MEFWDLLKNGLKDIDDNVHILKILSRNKPQMIVVVNGYNTNESEGRKISIVNCDLIYRSILEVAESIHFFLWRLSRIGTVVGSMPFFTTLEASSFPSFLWRRGIFSIRALI